MRFVEKADVVLSGEFKNYKNDTLYLQLEKYNCETSIYDSKRNFKDILKTFKTGEKITVYVSHGEATFKLIDVLAKNTEIIKGQIIDIDEDTFDILSGDIVEEYKILNSHRAFVTDQYVKGYTRDKGTYLMPTIDISNRNYNSFGELIEKSIIVNGKELNKKAQSVNGIVMVPLRETVESLGYEVTWNNDTRSVEILRLSQWTSITIDDNNYFKNRMAHQKLSHAPILINNSTYLPAEFLNVILDLALEVEAGDLTISESEMAIHRGYIQKIDYKASGQISITLSSKEMPDSMNDLTIIHASTATTYFNSTLEQGDLIHVISPPIMTMSIPGQTSTVVIY